MTTQRITENWTGLDTYVNNYEETNLTIGVRAEYLAHYERYVTEYLVSGKLKGEEIFQSFDAADGGNEQDAYAYFYEHTT